MKKFIPLCLLAMTMFSACSNDDEVVSPTEQTEVQDVIESFLCKTVPTVVSVDVFEKYAIGHAWKNVAEYEVDNKTGKAKDCDIWGRDGKTAGMYGGSPVHLAIEKGQLTSYYYADAIPADVYSTTVYKYDAGGIRLFSEKEQTYRLTHRIVSLDADKMVVLSHAGYHADRSPLYLYTTYQRMTQEERDAMVKAHPTNAKDL